jgi:hypothetical protein
VCALGRGERVCVSVFLHVVFAGGEGLCVCMCVRVCVCVCLVGGTELIQVFADLHDLK